MHILLLVQQTVQLLWNSQNGSQRHRWLVIFPLYFCQCFVSFVNILFGSGLKFCWVLGTRCCGGLLHLPMRILRAGAVPFNTHQCNVQAWTALIHVWREYAWIGERTLRTNLGSREGTSNLQTNIVVNRQQSGKICTRYSGVLQLPIRILKTVAFQALQCFSAVLAERSVHLRRCTTV